MTPEERAREIVERLSNRLRGGFAEILRLRSELNRAQQAIREAEQAAYERAAKLCGPHKDDDRMDRQIKAQIAQSIRSLLQKEGG